MKIFIKNMVCSRCEIAVSQIFHNLKIETISVELGSVETSKELSDAQSAALNSELKKIGFEILEDQSQKQIEQTKNLIISKIAEQDIPENFILSEFLSNEMHRDYSAISKLFSQNQGITLEQYFILQKIEKVKELLFYNELSLTEIAGKLGYKSVQHLSSQFKNTTGFTPTEFKKLKKNSRVSIDSL